MRSVYDMQTTPDLCLKQVYMRVWWNCTESSDSVVIVNAKRLRYADYAGFRFKTSLYAGMVELADTLDLGSNAKACRFKSCYPYQINRRDLTLRSWRFFVIRFRN